MKDHEDMTQNPTSVTIMQSSSENKKLFVIHAYQTNCIKEWAENHHVYEKIIIESPCSSIDQLE